MKFKKLGNTDLKVSVICLGTMTWGKQNNQQEAFEQMDYALDQGINFFDTAEMYSVPVSKDTFGKTETIIGNWFRERNNREKVILSTKITGPGHSWIRGGDLQYTRESISTALEGSLKRLQTDYIDLYQLHWPERNTNTFGKLGYEHKVEEEKWNSIESVLRVLKQFVDQGKIRYIGISNETPWGLSKFLQLSKLLDLPRVSSVQNPYNLLNRSYEVGLAEISIREQCGLLAHTPLACGVLTGKYRNNQKPKGSRLQLFRNYFDAYSGKLSLLAAEKYFIVAKKYNISPAQLSLAFITQQPFVTSTIIGATTMKQLKENIESVNIDLTAEIINELNLIHKNNSYPINSPKQKGLLNRFSFYLLTTTKLILKGNWTELAYKINKKIIKPIKSYVNSRNVGS
jgi:aryl-alcohol dehydrogenase-like predicted oxidoreductase